MKATGSVRRGFVVVSALVVFLVAPRANAQEAPFERHFAIAARVGLGTPVGAAGLMLEYSPWPQLSVGIGGGIGSGTTNVFHGAVTAVVRPFVRPTALNAVALEVALSTGGYHRLDLNSFVPPVDGPGYPDPVQPSATWASFLQFELAWEHRTRSGFLVRLGGGFATLLNPGALGCPGRPSSLESCANGSDESTTLPVVVDLSVGQTF